MLRVIDPTILPEDRLRALDRARIVLSRLERGPVSNFDLAKDWMDYRGAIRDVRAHLRPLGFDVKQKPTGIPAERIYYIEKIQPIDPSARPKIKNREVAVSVDFFHAGNGDFVAKLQARAVKVAGAGATIKRVCLKGRYVVFEYSKPRKVSKSA